MAASDDAILELIFNPGEFADAFVYNEYTVN